MNNKKAKALRKEVGFDPKAPRTYVNKLVGRQLTEDGKTVDVHQVSNDPNGPRAKYQAAKRGER